ncbi:phosphate ABC transporter permease PstA [Terrabacter carboxydivorans]|uniref:phosphate ABC transporter permease PstA n=1 Tax=Terrabacter carboxydivorans TaxID=619730 RepID=UPI0031DDBF48
MATAEERLIRYGSVAAALSLAWIITQRLLPWPGVLPFVLVTAVLVVLVDATLVAVTARRTDVTDRVVSDLVHLGALTLGVALLSTIAFTFWRGLEALPHPNQYTSDMAGVGPRAPLDQGGLLHAIVGTLIEIAIAVAISVPLGVGAAIFMTEVGGRLARIVRTIVEAMTALPSIVAGLFIYTAAIVSLGMPKSGLAAALALSVMMLPIIARASVVVLRVVPGSLREASLALGASQWKTVWHVVLPTARPGLATALILGIARGVGETSPVLLTSGAASFVVLDPTNGVMNSLPLYIYQAVRSGEPGLIVRGFGAASVLMALVLVLFVVARRLARQRVSRRPSLFRRLFDTAKETR